MSEQRTFSRAITRIKAFARQAHSLDDPPLFKSVTRQPAQQLAEGLKKAKLPDGLVDFLAGLDAKVDQLLAILSHDQLKEDFPIVLEVREISGAGMRFYTKAKIEKPGLLEVVIVLGHAPLRLAGAKGRVMGREETGLYRFEFSDIRDTDQEAIVQFVFQEERERLRSRKQGD